MKRCCLLRPRGLITHALTSTPQLSPETAQGDPCEPLKTLNKQQIVRHTHRKLNIPRKAHLCRSHIPHNYNPIRIRGMG